jgi:ADP-ribose pyrophosphatase YjhB (NUDIX family)
LSRGWFRWYAGAEMDFAFNVFDVWVFRRRGTVVEYLLLHTSQEKADRFFAGGRFWQIPSNAVEDGESVTDAIARVLRAFGLAPASVWAAEHAYTIYNRRFDAMQIIAVYAAEVEEGSVVLDPAEHAESAWCPFEEALARVHYRGLKDGLRSTREYVTGVASPAAQLRLM